MDRTVAEPLAAAAAALRRRGDALTGDVSARIWQEVAVLRGDETLRALLVESVRDNVARFVDGLSMPDGHEHPTATRGAEEFALRLAQRGIGAHALIRCYSIGKDALVEELIAEVSGLDCSAEVKFDLLRHLTLSTARFVDRTVQQVQQVHEVERNRWLRAQGTAQAAMVEDILAEREVPAGDFAAATGYSLSRVHVAMVLWAHGLGLAEPQTTLAAALADLRSLAGYRVLAVPVDRITMSVWIDVTDATPGPLPDADPRIGTGLARARGEVDRLLFSIIGVRAALGLPAEGVAGFRRSHAQATAAARVAGLQTGGGQVLLSPQRPTIAWDDEGVATVAAHAQDPAVAAQWVRAVLGDLALDTPAAATLRSTLHAYLRLGETHVEVAAALGLHRNTVRQRVTKALELVDDRAVAVDRSRIDVGTALVLCHHLGPAVLVPAAEH